TNVWSSGVGCGGSSLGGVGGGRRGGGKVSWWGSALRGAGGWGGGGAAGGGAGGGGGAAGGTHGSRGARGGGRRAHGYERRRRTARQHIVRGARGARPGRVPGVPTGAAIGWAVAGVGGLRAGQRHPAARSAARGAWVLQRARAPLAARGRQCARYGHRLSRSV